MRLFADIEGDNLLPDITRLWCTVFKEMTTGERFIFTPDNMDHLFRFLNEEPIDELIFHNGIGFDLPALKKTHGILYTIGPDTLLGKPCVHTDTLLMSKLFNPDRVGGHSLEEWGVRVGKRKGDFHDWSQYSQQMLDYCILDVDVLELTYHALVKESRQ